MALFVQFIVFLFALFLVLVHSITFNATVALDGSGNYKSISDAIAAVPDNGVTRFYIRVTSGIYHEHIEIPFAKKFIALIGDSTSTTIIVDNRSNRTGFGTAETATFTVNANNFIAKYITFENSAGPENGQALAFFNNANLTAYYKCKFLGFQDTLFIENRAFFKDCEVYGTVDFIFGGGKVVFQDCKLYARLLNTTTTITAQSKSYPTQNSGFSFQNCSITASPELGPREDNHNFELYLGRPWRDYSTVIFMESFMDSVVNPRGWYEWPGTPVNLLFHAEYKNNGPGADVSQRVIWPGYHVINNPGEAAQFTVENFIGGTEWLLETGIPFRPNL